MPAVRSSASQRAFATISRKPRVRAKALFACSRRANVSKYAETASVASLSARSSLSAV